VTEIPVAGAEVTGLLLGHQVELLAFRTEPAPLGSFVVTLAAPAVFRDAAGMEHRLDPHGPWDGLASLFALRGRTLVAATAGDDDRLEVTFDDGAALTVGPHPSRHGWIVTGPEELQVAAPPREA
jgi:hypothetical protein